MSTSSYRKCAKCGVNRINNPSVKMHRFPVLGKNNHNLTQLQSWAIFCYPDKDWSAIEDLMKLHKSNKVLCDQHFQDAAFTATDRKRLIKYARLFCLPSISTLRSLLNQLTLQPGINRKIFESLKNMAAKQTAEENICTLIFDEMSIKKNLSYNRKSDNIEGFQDHGKQGRTKQVATHALVFMLAGIRKKWKQPVALYLSGDSVTADRLSVLIKEVLHECLNSGLHVEATICDMDGVNVKALEQLGSTVSAPYFIFQEKEIVTLPDSYLPTVILLVLPPDAQSSIS